MELYLARHGNTFGPNDKVVWCDSKLDPELTAQGLSQAEALGRYFLNRKVRLDAVLCGSLRRQHQFAEIISKITDSLVPRIDARLNELDCGEWSGLTKAEIIERFGVSTFEAWDQRMEWPSKGAWPGSFAQVQLTIDMFVQELQAQYPADSKILLVSSGGILRFFLTLVPTELERLKLIDKLKMPTGSLSKLVLNRAENKLDFWFHTPDCVLGK